MNTCTRHSASRWALAVLVLTAAVTVWLFVAAPRADAVTMIRLDGMATTLTAEDAAMNLFFAQGIVPLPIGPATMALTDTSAAYTFPISGGSVADSVDLAGSIIHSGGLVFARRNANGTWTRYAMSKFVVRLDAQPDLTAVVNGKRQSVAKVDMTYALTKRKTVKKLRYITISGAKVLLTKETTDALEQTFQLAPGTLPDELLFGMALMAAREKKAR
jgi:hypothetical protein